MSSTPVQIVARAAVPTRYGTFDFHVFRETLGAPRNGLAADHVALVMGAPAGDGLLCRIHSECLTSEVFGSLKCDCAQQLEGALERIAAAGRGVLLYLRQEGRGIGLANKIRAYDLQSRGFDTVDANRMLDLPDDERDYRGAAAILDELGVRSVVLITNNPGKIEGLERHGVVVSGRVPSLAATSPLAEHYLRTKVERMGHLLLADGASPQEPPR